VKIAAGILAVVVIAAGALTLWFWEPWSDDEDSVDLSELSDEFKGSACRQVAGVAARLAEQKPPRLVFLRDLGRQVAGIRPPPRAYGDLARGGRNRIAGRGFLQRFDDGTQGQARHFAGIAVATSFGGGDPTRLISIFLRDDPAESPDGRLSDEAITFATEVLTGDLELDETPQWLLDHLCRRREAAAAAGP
jgi:hypothetical protein